MLCWKSILLLTRPGGGVGEGGSGGLVGAVEGFETGSSYWDEGGRKGAGSVDRQTGSI